MKYAVNFHSSFNHMDTIDEMIIKYENDKQRAGLLNYMQQKVRYDLRIIIAAENLETIEKRDIETFIAVQEIHPNFAVRLGLCHKDIISDFVNNKIPFFFDIFIDSWDMLNGIIQSGVSDVYIANELGFHLPRIKKISKDVKIRVFPNVAQSTDKLHILPTISSFFIRPEDIDCYEEYIDVCEFFGPADRHNVLYEIYIKGKWIGDLKELIIGLKTNCPNINMVHYFGEKRVNCKKSCSTGGFCNLCNQVCSLANSMQEKGLELKKDDEH